MIGKTNLCKTHLVLDGSVDLVEGGHSSKLLGDLLIVGPLLGVLTKLVLEVLEVLSPLLHLLGELGLQLGGLLGVVDLQVEVDAGGDDNELQWHNRADLEGKRGETSNQNFQLGSLPRSAWRAILVKAPASMFSLEVSTDLPISGWQLMLESGEILH